MNTELICSSCKSAEDLHHTIQSEGQSSLLCCSCYGRIFKPKVRCNHEKVEWITEDGGTYKGWKITVSYKVTSPEEWQRTQRTIARIVREAEIKMELEKFKAQKDEKNHENI